jgi:hypothetical protein
MKTLILFGLALVLCLSVVSGEGMPNLVGNWTLTNFEGATFENSPGHLNTNSTGNVTWISKDFPAGEVMLFIKEQRGHTFAGTWMRPSNPENVETIIGVIASDNNSIYMTNGDTYREGRLVSPSEMELIGTENNSEGMDDFYYSKVQ